MIGVSTMAVSKWLREFGCDKKIKQLRRNSEIIFLDSEEIDNFLRKKTNSNNKYIAVMIEMRTLPKNRILLMRSE